MKKMLLPLILISSLYGYPPCEFDKDYVCMYNYAHGLIAEVNIINMTQKKVSIDATASLDGQMRSVNNFILNPNETITLLKSRYEKWEQKPNYGYRSFSYKFID